MAASEYRNEAGLTRRASTLARDLRRDGTAAMVALSLLVPGSTLAAQSAPPQGAQASGDLTPKVGRWEGDSKTRKGPPGFDLQAVTVGYRFDGKFAVDGVPTSVREGQPFEVQVKLSNVGKKDLKLSGLVVTGADQVLPSELLLKKVKGKTMAVIGTFSVPPQSYQGTTVLVTVVMKNGDKHRTTLSFTRPS